VRGESAHGSAENALAGFHDFPRWMWGNTDFRDFIERLRTSNLGRAPKDRVGVYGMDVYDLFDAADGVVAYLHTVDPAAAARAQSLYACFAAYGRSTHAYGQAAVEPARSCQPAAAAVRDELARLPAPAALPEAERHFGAVRAAVSVAAAEEYFRALYADGRSWNIRDQQMARNVDDTAAHVAQVSGRTGKVITWSHNTHTGDARATEAAQRGELNLGQLMRERHGEAAFLIGFLSYTGRVMAAPEWDRPGRVYEVPPARPESHAALLKSSGIPAFSLVLRGNAGLAQAFAPARPQRAIGVVYAVQAERIAHYMDARLSPQFDAAVFIETTGAVTPLGK
jgi:erythromycin esterase-like protein